jgi:hypothetical protein
VKPIAQENTVEKKETQHTMWLPRMNLILLLGMLLREIGIGETLWIVYINSYQREQASILTTITI